MSSSSQRQSTVRFQFSAGEDEEQLGRDAASLTTGGQGRWRVTDDNRGLERTFRFKTFKATWEFMNTVAAECKVQKHHPEWTNVFNKTHVRWTTHKPIGLSSKDIIMARFCDEAGTRHGELADATDDECGCGDFKP
ncbi:transcriptional coactivator/pterin dehydratase [Aureobasidium namibiae CBS 147.97]|uniref:4a-hydroxytetrahydrobiopterin dehydratase n=1 Tax=Aureobasidium namibiae CBS 147.97 TaxID=1043004 RepID=A0A074WFB6_9PEZI|nr:transcriptional coactivator/pterin dehydratase [Aureobasidium namibiae CBS 147.97]KEQ71790.1 transcriptional coactivator/pterin dehydratase [Aureobasidium namibiae CBS 147.97]